MNFTKSKLKLVHSTQTLVFIQGSTDYVRNTMDAVGDKDCQFI